MPQKNDFDLGTTAAELDHYFGNHIGITRLWLQEGGDFSRNYNECKQKFIEGMRRTIKKRLPEAKGVKIQHLEEIAKLVETLDLSDINDLKEIYKRYYEISGRNYDEKKLFPSS